MLLRVVMSLDRSGLAAHLKKSLNEKDILVEEVRPRKDLWPRLARTSADIFVISHALAPAPVADSIAMLRGLPDSPMVMMLCDRESPAEESSLLAAGCDAAIFSGLPPKNIVNVLTALLAKRKSQAKPSLLEAGPLAQPRLADFVSSSAAMTAFLEVVRRVVDSDAALLLTGETGVGKERLARAIHAEGPNSEGPFIAVNCGGLPETLLESELFGHEEGAFTGASRARRGWFELAHRGSIFLDEIGEMPFHLQVKLLRFLQEHEIQRLGSERSIHVNVRVMAATNQDLEALVKAGRFRSDLYYRLSVVTLSIPPLRDRREDIPELIESYIDYLQYRIGRPIKGIQPAAIEAMCRYAWPGNVRELINVVERAMLLCRDGEISLADLPGAIRACSQQPPGAAAPTFPLPGGAMPDAWLSLPWTQARQHALDACERAYLEGLLAKTRGRVGQTAKMAGVSPRSIYEKMKRHGLTKETYRKLGA